MEPWLLQRGAVLHTTQLWKGESLPDIANCELVIAMGGPMSVNDETEHPWLKAEKQFLREVIAEGLPTVGICLGAQLIASALGAEVRPNPEKEIGWLPIQGIENPNCFRFPDQAEVFHWHGETFELPPSAVRIAESKACTNQAFQLGTNVIGMQFHLETTSKTAALLIDNCRYELIDAPYIQTEEQLRATHPERYEAINMLMGQVLEYVIC